MQLSQMDILAGQMAAGPEFPNGVFQLQCGWSPWFRAHMPGGWVDTNGGCWEVGSCTRWYLAGPQAQSRQKNTN